MVLIKSDQHMHLMFIWQYTQLSWCLWMSNFLGIHENSWKNWPTLYVSTSGPYAPYINSVTDLCDNAWCSGRKWEQDCTVLLEVMNTRPKCWMHLFIHKGHGIVYDEICVIYFVCFMLLLEKTNNKYASKKARIGSRSCSLLLSKWRHNMYSPSDEIAGGLICCAKKP